MVILDYNATTPVESEVISEMLPYFNQTWGNPSSKHPMGQRASEALEVARLRVSSLIGADPSEIIFTSGGTEATNLAIMGGINQKWPFVGRLGFGGIISSVLEHPATIECLKAQQSRGIAFKLVSANRNGQLNINHLENLLWWQPRLATFIHAHNETGTIQPISLVSSILKKFGVLLHVDASQSVGKIRVDVNELGADFLTIAGHKFGAPKGIGALYARKGTILNSQIFGAGQENGLRGGTQNVPYIVGLGKAASLVNLKKKQELAELRNLLWRLLSGNLGDRIRKYTHEKHSLPNTLFVSIKHVLSFELLKGLPTLIVSTGSACHDGTREGSSILRAMGESEDWIRGTVRFSLGDSTTKSDVEIAARMISGEISNK